MSRIYLSNDLDVSRHRIHKLDTYTIPSGLHNMYKSAIIKKPWEVATNFKKHMNMYMHALHNVTREVVKFAQKILGWSAKWLFLLSYSFCCGNTKHFSHHWNLTRRSVQFGSSIVPHCYMLSCHQSSFLSMFQACSMFNKFGPIRCSRRKAIKTFMMWPVLSSSPHHLSIVKESLSLSHHTIVV